MLSLLMGAKKIFQGLEVEASNGVGNKWEGVFPSLAF